MKPEEYEEYLEVHRRYRRELEARMAARRLEDQDPSEWVLLALWVFYWLLVTYIVIMAGR